MKTYSSDEDVRKFIKKKKGLLKLNIGCGTDYKKGWINIDNNSDNNIKKLDINWDLRKPLPIDDGTIDFIFNEHFIEHLSVNEARVALKEFKRILKEDGVMRIAMPDLKDVIANYLDPDWKNKPYIKRFNMQFIQTGAELININFRWWGHKWLYDWEELERRLFETGFKSVERKQMQKSNKTELSNLETREESTLIAEVKK